MGRGAARAGASHLHYTALPEWASTLGMIFSVMLWAPSWGGMINGLLTLRGGWQKVVDDPILKFFVVGITAYGMSTFEGPMLSIKSVNALAHYTDWIIAHVHTGALGWNGFLTFGMVYWLLPRLFQAPLHSKKLAGLHFWIATFGIILYVVAIYSAGVTQGLMWRAFDETGRLMYPDFVETVAKLMPMYWVRVVGGSLYIVGMLLFGWNILMTWRARPKTYEVPVIRAAPLSKAYVPDPEHVPAVSPLLLLYLRLCIVVFGLGRRIEIHFGDDPPPGLVLANPRHAVRVEPEKPPPLSLIHIRPCRRTA